jgi:DNA-binding MarR family transcriptional regulator
VPATADDLQGLLRQWRAVMASSRPRWAAADLTFTQLRALSAIERRGGMRVGDLAEELEVGLAAASALADRMVRRKFITRATAPNDRRSVRLELASRGRGLLERLERGSIDHLGKLIERMTPAERDALATTLRAFVRLGAEHSLRKGPEGLLIVRRDEKC